MRAFESSACALDEEWYSYKIRLLLRDFEGLWGLFSVFSAEQTGFHAGDGVWLSILRIAALAIRSVVCQAVGVY